MKELLETNKQMRKPCDICLEEKCDGKHDCHCDTCSLKDKCYRKLHATIRITNKCTQECSHCCFASSPKSSIMMSIEKAKEIAKFLKVNDVETINLMGGEFFCNPNWFEIYSELIASVKFARLVTNGDWANNLGVKAQLATLISIFGKKIYFSISKDKWHTNKYVDSAKEFLESAGCKVNIGTEDNTKNESIVPVGRAAGRYIGGIYDMFGCYCQNPENMYSFLIDEEGNIFKCSFGVLSYAHIDDYLEGGFRKRFKEANSKFYSVFVPSCQTCYNFISLQKPEFIVSYN